MIEIRVLKPFRYAADGRVGIILEAGLDLGLPDDIVPGLVAEGFVEEVGADKDPAPAEGEPVTRVTDSEAETPKPADPVTTAVSSPAGRRGNR